MLPRIYLWICVVVFAGLGIALAGWPEAILKSVEIQFESPSAFSDIRADYGGCILGVGIFLGWCAIDSRRVFAGLLCTALIFSGYAAARLLSIVVDGIPNQTIFIVLTVELVGAAVAYALLPHASIHPGNLNDGEAEIR